MEKLHEEELKNIKLAIKTFKHYLPGAELKATS